MAHRELPAHFGMQRQMQIYMAGLAGDTPDQQASVARLRELDVLFDSGIRCGADVLKAIALGARAVLIGRPYGYGLAARGEDGVPDVLGNLLADVDLSMGLAGCRSVRQLDRSLLREVR